MAQTIPSSQINQIPGSLMTHLEIDVTGTLTVELLPEPPQGHRHIILGFLLSSTVQAEVIFEDDSNDPLIGKIVLAAADPFDVYPDVLAFACTTFEVLNFNVLTAAAVVTGVLSYVTVQATP